MGSENFSSVGSGSSGDASCESTPGAIESLIANVLGVCTENVDRSARLWDDFGVDRTELLELANEIETTLGIKIGTEPLQRLVVVQDFVDCVVAAASVPPVVHAGTRSPLDRWPRTAKPPSAVVRR